MRRSIRTALFAAADEDVRRQIPFLLASCEIVLLDALSDGFSASQSLLEHRPDLLIAEACLPAMDGCTLARRVLADGAFPVRPRVLVLHRQELAASDRAKLEEAGAMLLAWPADPKDFRVAVGRLETQPVSCSEKMSKRADQLLEELGFPHHAGTQALKWCAILCAEDERLLHKRGERLYCQVGEMLSLSPQAVERALRHVIGAAWQSNQFENQYRIFADTVDAGRGQPTCGEMIAGLADILRLEG